MSHEKLANAVLRFLNVSENLHLISLDSSE